MAKRSPILGYNHNVRHRGLLFHIQTEDSGVDNPHIFTHLFHGGVIIASRKLEYDPESAEDVVKSLMQAQHKASLRALKSGTFDEKISTYLVDQPGLQPPATGRAARDTVESTPPPAPVSRQTGPQRAPEPPAPPPLTRVGRPPTQPPALAAQGQLDNDAAIMTEPSRTARTDDVSAAFRLIKREPTAPVAESSVEIEILPGPAGKRRAGSQTGYSLHRTGQLEVIPEIHDQPTAPVARGKGRAPAVVSPIAARPPSAVTRPAGKHPTPPSPTLRPAPRPPPPPAVASPGPRAAVVVARPAVIVGAPPRIVSPREGSPPVPRNIRRARESTRPSLFGKDLISERSLDEVILAYLSEDATEK